MVQNNLSLSLSLPLYLLKLHYLYFIPRRLFKQVKASVCIALPGCAVGNITAALDYGVSPQTRVG